LELTLRKFALSLLLVVPTAAAFAATLITIAPGGVGEEDATPPPSGPNSVPTFTCTPSLSMPQDAVYANDLGNCTSDLNGDALTFSLEMGDTLPTGISLVGDTLSGTPTVLESASFSIGVTDGNATTVADAVTTTTAFDDHNFTAPQDQRMPFTIVVTPVADAVNLVFGWSDQADATTYDQIRTPIRCLSGLWRAYDGALAGYASSAIVCNDAVEYTIEGEADLVNGSWSATIDDGGGAEALATSFTFRGTTTPTELLNFVTVDAATVGSTITASITQPVYMDFTALVFSDDEEAPATPDAPTFATSTPTGISMTPPTSEAEDHACWDWYGSDDDMAFELLANCHTGTTYTETGLTSPQTRYYAVVDQDGAGNESAQGPSASGDTDEPEGNWPKLTWDTVGIGHTGSPALYTGPTTLTTDGATIENVRVTTSLLVEANNVTFRNVHFDICGYWRALDDGNDGAVHESNTGIVVEDSTFEGSTATANAQIFMRGGWTVRRSRFRDSAGDTIKITGGNGQPILIEGNYFEGMGHNFNGGTHSDGYQINKSDTALVTIRGNTFNMPAEPFLPVVEGGCNDGWGATDTILGRVLYFGSNSGSFNTALIEYNHIEGNQYSITNASTAPANQIVVRCNIIGREFKNAPWSGAMTKGGNIWETSGVVESPNIGPGDSWYGPWVANALLPGQSVTTCDF
jgi:hypothetical protein